MSTVQQVQAVGAVLSALLAVICGCTVLVAKNYAAVVNILEAVHRAGIPVRGAKGQPSPAPGGGSVAGGAATTPSGLLPLDPVNQLTGVTVSSAPAPTGPVDCGPACVVSCIAELHGCWSSDELLRLRYFGTVDARLTTATDLVGMLRANHIAAHAVESSYPNVRAELLRAAQLGHPCLVLGNWLSPNLGHWFKFRGDTGLCNVMDPYGGVARSISWSVFASLYLQSYVHIDGTTPPLEVS